MGSASDRGCAKCLVTRLRAPPSPVETQPLQAIHCFDWRAQRGSNPCFRTPTQSAEHSIAADQQIDESGGKTANQRGVERPIVRVAERYFFQNYVTRPPTGGQARPGLPCGIAGYRDSLLNPFLPSPSSQALHMRNPVRQIRMLAGDVIEAPVGGDVGILLLNREGRVSNRKPDDQGRWPEGRGGGEPAHRMRNGDPRRFRLPTAPFAALPGQPLSRAEAFEQDRLGVWPPVPIPARSLC